MLAALVGSLVAISPSSAFAQGGNPNTNRLDVPVSGTLAGGGSLTGQFAISKFAIQGGQLVALGKLTASYTDVLGQTQTIVTNLAWPVSSESGSAGADFVAACDASVTEARACDILELILGPLHLDLLGLVVDLNQVVLTITATTGSGDLLGNLLCAITGLLDAGSIGTQLVNLLNQLVGILAGL